MNNNNLLILIYFSLCCITIFQKTLFADSVSFSGTVQDENNQAIENAEVSLYNRSQIQTTTDNNGAFILTGTTGITSYHVSHSPSISLNGNCIHIDLQSDKKIRVTFYTLGGKKIFDHPSVNQNTGAGRLLVPVSELPSGISLLVVHCNENRYTYTCVVTGNRVHTTNKSTVSRGSAVSFSISNTSDFSDILIVSATGYQTIRRAVTVSVEEDIKIKLMPSGVGYITPTIPVYSDKGGTGDVTTYGSVSDPEYSQGGACNYGSTKILYYAAINVSQFPGDKQGQWQDGQICGRCARVRILTTTGEERTTVVRIMDKCPDDNCGIDLGGAPAGEIMKTQAGRYAGEWEWVNCDSVEGVSDGAASLYVKTGSNQWWSLVQARNGPGSVAEMRVRKAGTTEWQILNWAIEAENFLKLPEVLLQDSGNWEIEVQWSTGSVSTLTISGNKLSIEDAVYDLQE